jgi:hypothetical protein
MHGRRRLRPLFLLISLFLFNINGAFAIDWDSDIVPTADELETAKKDALSIYFGKQADDEKLYRSYEYMSKLVGEHVDVPLK